MTCARLIRRSPIGLTTLCYLIFQPCQERRRGLPYFYVLAAGDVHIDIGVTEGALAVDRPGEVSGWPALVEPYRYTATARCVRDTKVINISRDLVEAAIKEHPGKGYALLLFRDDFMCFPASGRFLPNIIREYAYIPVNFQHGQVYL
jgi:hypothetical protein